MASVSCSSPPTPGVTRSSCSKISGVKTYRPMTAMFDGASEGWGFSTMSSTRTRPSLITSGFTQP